MIFTIRKSATSRLKDFYPPSQTATRIHRWMIRGTHSAPLFIGEVCLLDFTGIATPSASPGALLALPKCT